MTKKTLFSISANFLKELIMASKGKSFSLSFLKNPLPQQPLVFGKEIFQIIVIGGSVLKSVLIKFQQGKFTILFQKKETSPPLKTKKTLLCLIEKHLHPSVNLLSLNFAFPLKPKVRNNLLDGQLIRTTKEYQLKGLVNNLVAEELEKYIFQQQERRVRIVVANDTICLLLAGLSQTSWSNLLAGIVGSGTNFAFFVNEKMAVNLESGNFNHFPQTKTGKIIDQLSTNPGKQLFEKEVAGAYLFRHYNLLKKFSLINSTFELNQLAKKGDLLARKLFDHSASLIASQIAGIYFFKKTGKENLKLKIIMEGSVFWEGWRYKDKVLKYLNLLGIKKKKIEFIKIENSDVVGALELIKNSFKMV